MLRKNLPLTLNGFRATLASTYVKAKRLMPLPALDVVVKAGKFVIPEKGHAGFCPGSWHDLPPVLDTTVS
jgi:hypothetical protein